MATTKVKTVELVTSDRAYVQLYGRRGDKRVSK